jgi:hypothetical protein
MCCTGAKFVPCLLIDDQKENRVEISQELPHSPDLVPGEFFLFLKLKTTLKGCCFQTIEETQENSITELRTITESVFQEAFQQWKKH